MAHILIFSSLVELLLLLEVSERERGWSSQRGSVLCNIFLYIFSQQLLDQGDPHYTFSRARFSISGPLGGLRINILQLNALSVSKLLVNLYGTVVFCMADRFKIKKIIDFVKIEK